MASEEPDWDPPMCELPSFQGELVWPLIPEVRDLNRVSTAGAALHDLFYFGHVHPLSQFLFFPQISSLMRAIL